MNILFIGDIYGESGRNAIKEYLPSLKKRYEIDFVIANGENATHGRGLSVNHYNELISYGIDVITVGNHFFSRNNNASFYEKADKLVRPYNLLSSTNGLGSREFNFNNIKIRVTSILCKVWMKEFDQLDIYQSMDKCLLDDNSNIHIVDIHGEATAEKLAFAHNYANKLSAVIGTHTHVQTADEDIFDKHCGYISDVGMSGPYESVIGADIAQVIAKSKSPVPLPFDVSHSKAQFNAVLLNIDENGTCKNIERINLRPGRDY